MFNNFNIIFIETGKDEIAEMPEKKIKTDNANGG